MLRFFAALVAMLQLASPYDAPSARAIVGMKTGITLRMHVIAHDDTPTMQAVKLLVRDGVQDAYAALTEENSLPMLVHAARLLPELESAATDAAQSAGFSGRVEVTLTITDFDERTLDGLTIPAGRYPALVIRLGDAQGRNWWGLVDRRLALACAAAGHDGTDEQTPVWDWSLDALIDAWTMLLSSFAR